MVYDIQDIFGCALMFLNIELFYKKIQNLDRRGKRKREKNIFFIEMKEKKK